MIISKCTSKPEYKLRETCIKENLTANRFRGSKNCKPINCEKEEHIFIIARNWRHALDHTTCARL